MINIKNIDKSEIGRIAEIDRSEHVTLGYSYRDGTLESEQVDWQVPRWFADDRPEHSVPGLVRDLRPYLEKGGTMFGAFDGDLLVGIAIFRPGLTETMAQLVFLHVSRDYRRQGIATKLTAEAVRLAEQDGAKELYVSATPSESAVGFYRSHGFQLVEKPYPELYELEPEDIHMIMTL